MDRVAQVLSGRVGDHNRHHSREHLENAVLAVVVASPELLEGALQGNVEVVVAQQCSQGKTCQREGHTHTRGEGGGVDGGLHIHRLTWGTRGLPG